MFDTGVMALPLRSQPPVPPRAPDGEVSDRRAVARALAERIRPLVPAGDRRLEVDGPLAPLVDGGVGRGSTVTIEGIGATSLALALAAALSPGRWCVVVGLDELAPIGALEAGIDPARCAFVGVDDGDRVAEVLAALVVAIDVVVVDARLSVRPAAVRRLGARVRERGGVVVVVHPDGGSIGASWSGDVVMAVRAGTWDGPGRGDGHLQSRSVVVDVTGRGRAARPRRHELSLPG